jgi:hypothetical protein
VARWLVCVLVVAAFTWNISLFFLPAQAFTFLIEFGGREHARFLPELRATNHYEMPRSPGYDSQWYAQIAMHPRLSDPVLKRSVDSLAYRARRILFEWTAWVIGGGDPTRVMEVYAFQNIFCWYVIAALLFRWLPPVNWGNCFRWACVMGSFGLIFSVRAALLDGPSLLLVMLAMVLLEKDRPYWGALLLGISGLGKDTNVLCGTAITPADPKDRSTWARPTLQWILVLAPLALWVACISLWLGRSEDIGHRNFDWPFSGLVNKAQDLVSSALAHGYPAPTVLPFDILVAVGLVAQFFFFVFRMRWRDPWWRLGAGYAVLMIFLGDAVWESYPSAAARVLLPMVLAFNLLVPRGRWWPLLLIAGNLGVLGSPDLLKPPGRETQMVKGPAALLINPGDNAHVEVLFGPDNWWDNERSRWDYFRWSLGDSTITIRNPQSFAMTADIHFGLRAVDHRGAKVSIDGAPAFQGVLLPAEVRSVSLPGVVLRPGDTVLLFQSDRAAAYPGNNDRRRLTFSVRDFEVDLKEQR